MAENVLDDAEAPPAPSVITCNGRVEEGVDRADVEEHLRDGAFFWLDVPRPSKEDLDWLGETLHLHPLVREDIDTFSQRPKLDPYDGYGFLVVYGASGDEDGLVEVHCVVSETYVVTIHRDPAPSFEALWERYRRHEPVEEGALLLYRVVDSLVDSFFPALAEADDKIEAIEEEIFSVPRAEQLQQIVGLKHGLLKWRRVVTAQRDLFAQITTESVELPGSDEEAERYFRDLYDHLIRLTDILDSYRDALSSSTDVYLSARADRRDDVMKQLTVIATVFLPITFITGFFGMNFGFLVRHIGSAGAFAAGTLSMLVTVAAILTVFRRRGWV